MTQKALSSLDPSPLLSLRSAATLGARRRCSTPLLLRFVLFAMLAGLLRPVLADTAPPIAASPAVAWNRSLDDIEARLARGDLDSSQIDVLWAELISVRKDAFSAAEALESKNHELQRLIGALGPKPADGDPPETPELQAQRRQLQQALADQESELKQANLAVERGDTLIGALGAARRSRLSADLLAPLPNPLDPATWARASDQLQEFDNELQRGGRMLGSGLLSLASLAGLILGFTLALHISNKITHGTLRRIAQRHGDEVPSYRRRVRAAIVIAVLQGLLPAALFIGWLVFLWITLERYHLLSEQTIKPIGISTGIIFYFLLGALARAVIRPRTPNFQLLPVPPAQALKLARRIELLIGVLALDIPFIRILNLSGRPDDLLSVHTFVLSLTLVLSFSLLLPDRLWHSTTTDAESAGLPLAATSNGQWRWRSARWLTFAVFLAALVASVTGYGHLGLFLVRGTLRTLLLVVLLIASRGVVRETLTYALTGSETQPREGFGVLAFWLLAIADIVILTAGTLAFLLSWGVPWVPLRSLIGGTLGGFTIGQFRIAPGDILLAILVFSAMVLVTRFLQRQLEEHLLPRTRLDIGSRTAITAGAGYVGIGLAFVTGVTIAGIDLSQMALIAGALSVGIGFGLQNVVNNFISGAILLAEQPIKIGDWIVVGEIEGNVRRINIRATEIETFNRASVIVPNADLLQTSVTNWTYKNRKGRIDIPIGVAYGSDPDQVEHVLLACAQRHETVIRWPESYVLLTEFADSSMNFELRVFVSDIENRHRIASDLRKAILREFRTLGIEIPFPQREVRVIHQTAGAVGDVILDEGILDG